MRLDARSFLGLLHDRWIMWTGVILAVCILARPVINMALFDLTRNWTRSTAMSASSSPTPTMSVSAPSTSPAHHHATKGDLNSLPLRSELRTYEIRFNGMVNCGGQPFPTELEMVVLSGRHDTQIHRFIPVKSDGSFETKVTIQDVLRSGLEWRLTARLATGTIVEGRGRQILMNDSVINIEAPLCPR